MRRFSVCFVVVLQCLLVLGLFVDVGFAQEYHLFNHDFEDGTLGDYWFFTEGTGAMYPTTEGWYISSANPQEGSYAVANGWRDSWIYQYIEFLPSSWLDNITFYGYCSGQWVGDNIQVNIQVHYTDESFDIYPTDVFDRDDGWQEFVVGNFSGNKLINFVAFQINPLNSRGSPYGMIDDVTFGYSTDFLNVETGGFTYSLDPSAVSYDSEGFVGLIEQNYVFEGTFLNASGLVDNVGGEFMVDFQLEGDWNGLFYGGHLYFAIAPRLVPVQENIRIIITPEIGEIVVVTLSVSWVEPESVPDSRSVVNLIDLLSEGELRTFALDFMIIGIPAFLFGSVGMGRGFAVEGMIVGGLIGLAGMFMMGRLNFLFMTVIGIGLLYMVVSKR